MTVLIQLVLTAVGCYLIGSEYSTTLGWGLWLILISMD
jgi:hypothetical protein